MCFVVFTLSYACFVNQVSKQGIELAVYWNSLFSMMSNLSLAASEIVVLTTYDDASDDKFGITVSKINDGLS